MKLSRYRMKTHEALDYGRIVNACFSKDVQDLEDNYCSIKEKLEDLETFVGSALDAWDLLPADVKELLEDERLGEILNNKLQETDLLYNVEACSECGTDPGCNINCPPFINHMEKIK